MADVSSGDICLFFERKPMKLQRKHIKEEYITFTECVVASLPLIQQRIDGMKEKLNTLRDDPHLKTLDYSQERVQTSGITKSTEVIALENMREEAELKIVIKQEEKQLAWYMDHFKVLDQVSRDILHKKCFDGLSWEEVADELHVSRSTSIRIYKSSIVKLTVAYYGAKAMTDAIHQENPILCIK